MLEGNATARFRGIVATDMVAQQAPNKRCVIYKEVGGKELLAISRQTRLGKHGS